MTDPTTEARDAVAKDDGLDYYHNVGLMMPVNYPGNGYVVVPKSEVVYRAATGESGGRG